jgi:RNA polymerase sigma-70 factor (ECF subfamily)
MHAASQIAEALPSDQSGCDLISDIKNLRSFAICLSGSISAADDLVEATLLRAWSKSDCFRVATDRRLGFLTILRDIIYSNFRKRAVDVQSGGYVYTDRIKISGDQEGHFNLQDFRKTLAKLPAYQL